MRARLATIFFTSALLILQATAAPSSDGAPADAKETTQVEKELTLLKDLVLKYLSKDFSPEPEEHIPKEAAKKISAVYNLLHGEDGSRTEEISNHLFVEFKNLLDKLTVNFPEDIAMALTDTNSGFSNVRLNVQQFKNDFVVMKKEHPEASDLSVEEELKIYGAKLQSYKDSLHKIDQYIRDPKITDLMKEFDLLTETYEKWQINRNVIWLEKQLERLQAESEKTLPPDQLKKNVVEFMTFGKSLLEWDKLYSPEKAGNPDYEGYIARYKKIEEATKALYHAFNERSPGGLTAFYFRTSEGFHEIEAELTDLGHQLEDLPGTVADSPERKSLEALIETKLGKFRDDIKTALKNYSGGKKQFYLKNALEVIEHYWGHWKERGELENDGMEVPTAGGANYFDWTREEEDDPNKTFEDRRAFISRYGEPDSDAVPVTPSDTSSNEDDIPSDLEPTPKAGNEVSTLDDISRFEKRLEGLQKKIHQKPEKEILQKLVVELLDLEMDLQQWKKMNGAEKKSNPDPESEWARYKKVDDATTVLRNEIDNEWPGGILGLYHQSPEGFSEIKTKIDNLKTVATEIIAAGSYNSDPKDKTLGIISFNLNDLENDLENALKSSDGDPKLIKLKAELYSLNQEWMQWLADGASAAKATNKSVDVGTVEKLVERLEKELDNVGAVDEDHTREPLSSENDG